MKVIMIYIYIYICRYTHDKGIYIYITIMNSYHIVLYHISPIQLSQQGIQPGHPEEQHLLMVPDCYFQLTSPRSSAGSISGRLSIRNARRVFFLHGTW